MDVNGDIYTKRGGFVGGVKWNPIPITELGTLPINPLGTNTWDIPNVIPSTAKEILVFAWVQTGNCDNNHKVILKLYTVENTNEYSHYLMAVSWTQGAISYNSSTFWIPTTSEWKIKATSSGSGTISGRFKSSINIIGYR